MTPTPDQPDPTAKNSGSKVLIGVLVGCGCLTFGVFLLGIITAIALPSFLNQANKARQSEATNNLNAILRAQQAYFLENSAFAESPQDLNVTVPDTTVNYRYQLRSPSGSPLRSVITATALSPNLPSYTGIAFVAKENNMFIAKICKTEAASQEPPVPAPPTSAGEPIKCPPGSVEIE